MHRNLSKRFVFTALVVAMTVGGSLAVPQRGETNTIDSFQGSPNGPDLLKCKRVHPRFSVCGDTNFKNRVVAGFGIHFSVVDPQGRLAVVGQQHAITEQPQSCNALMNEASVPLAARKTAIAACKTMIQEHFNSTR